jgi:hypothetical protein
MAFLDAGNPRDVDKPKDITSIFSKSPLCILKADFNKASAIGLRHVFAVQSINTFVSLVAVLVSLDTLINMKKIETVHQLLL